MKTAMPTTRRKPPHLTVPYEKPEGEPDGFRLPPPEASRARKAVSYEKKHSQVQEDNEQ